MRLVNVIFAFLMLFVLSCNDAGQKNSETGVDGIETEMTRVKIIDSVYHFGKIKEGNRVVFSYRFVNKGKKPLKISQTYSSCGCTVTEFSSEPVLPGKEGFIKVSFNSDGVEGIIDKFIDVSSNAVPEFPRLYLQGEVIN